MRISIVTLFDNGNYGSELQSMAMTLYLKNKDYEPVLCHIKAPNKALRLLEVLVDAVVLKINTFFNAEMKMYLTDCTINAEKQRSISSELKEYVHSFVSRHIVSERVSRWNVPNGKFDAYICGSDQIWSALKLPICSKLFLNGVSSDRKIAYAPSMGLDTLPTYYIKKVGKYISDFKYLSVREEAAKHAILENFGIDALQVLDPTMLVGRDVWDSLLAFEGKKTPKKKYIFCYFLGELSDDTVRCINDIAKEYEVIILPYEEDSIKVRNGNYQLADPLDFVNLIKHAQYVLTDSFHGSVFSVLYEKQFVVTKRTHVGRVAQTSRITSLLTIFGLEKQYCQYSNEMLNALKTNIDYSTIYKQLENEQKISRAFLDNALDEINKTLKK